MKIHVTVVIALAIVLTTVLMLGSELVEGADISPEYQHQVYQVPTNPIPTFVGSQEKPAISARSVLVIDIPSASILYQTNSHEQYAPASTTKLMTAYIVRKKFDLSDQITAPVTTTIGGARVNFVPGKQYTVYDLLQALLIPSANDAAYILAQAYPGGLDRFVDKMNASAQELGMTRTQFENPAGFDALIHKTTAYDLALLSKEIMNDPVLSHIVSTKNAVISDVDKTVQHSFVTTNQLLGVVPGIRGIKTGTTSQAGEVLISNYASDQRNLLIIVLGSDQRYQDTTELLDWVLSSYEWQSNMIQ